MEAFTNKTKLLTAKPIHDLPIAKDLPRFAFRMSIKNDLGIDILTPSPDVPTPEYLRRIFFTVAEKVNLEEDKFDQLKKAWSEYMNEAGELESILKQIIAASLDDNNRVMRVLKNCNQAVTAPAVIEFKLALGPMYPTKDVPNGWSFVISFLDECILVQNIKREQSIAGLFMLEWVLSMEFDFETVTCQRVTLQISEFEELDKSTPEKIRDVRAILRKFFKEDRRLSMSAEKSHGINALSKSMSIERPVKTNEARIDGGIPGEKIISKDETAKHLGVNGAVPGTLWITTYRIVFVPLPLIIPMNTGLKYSLERAVAHFEIALTSIHRVKKLTKFSDQITITCKDVRKLTLCVSDRDGFIEKLSKCQPSTITEIFAFSFAPKKMQDCDGWDNYIPMNEFKRLRFPTDKWRLSQINSEFRMCDSYPEALIVPYSATEEDIRVSFGFRKSGRVPTIIWKHPTTMSTISRTAPPESSGRNINALEDRRLLESLAKTTNPRAQFYLVDILPREKIETPYTTSTTLISSARSINSTYFATETFDMESISSLKDSFSELCKISQNGWVAGEDDEENTPKWVVMLEATGWLQQLQEVMAYSLRVIEMIEQGASVLLESPDHCDRIPQLTSLALLMMDPFYRTMRGFQVLIEKEWNAFGHRFRERCGYLSKQHEDAPLFLQFLDCVWQLTQQFPYDFEFNTKFLITVAHHLNTGLYGNFIMNTPAESRKYKVQKSTVSIWAHVNKLAHEFRNYNFSLRNAVLVPSLSYKRLQLWCDYYLRYSVDSQFVGETFAQEGGSVGINSSNGTNSRLKYSEPEAAVGQTNDKDSKDSKKLQQKNAELVRKLEHQAAQLEELKRENERLKKHGDQITKKYKSYKEKHRSNSTTSLHSDNFTPFPNIRLTVVPSGNQNTPTSILSSPGSDRASHTLSSSLTPSSCITPVSPICNRRDDSNTENWLAVHQSASGYNRIAKQTKD
eukprot:TRINITY_DN6232_c0_g1_i1.p1 TRINITY_DN6232_c0_g1~~TRINITY_DN6232_c0_g1_i1.p1  ORF type:complete len:966 (+),score=254.75 TRINITY_DN6232_c0_g1_i1:186-3083(+)